MHRRPAGSIGQRELDACYFALNQHALVSRTDASGNIIFVNDKFCEVSGYTCDELIGKNHRVLNSGFHPAAFFDGMWARIASGQVWQGVIRNQTKAGDYYWVISTIVPELGEHGLPVSYLSLRTDITASLKIESALQRSEEQYRLLAENMHDVVLLLDLDGRVQYASPSAGTLLGGQAQRLAGAELLALVHPDERGPLADGLQRLRHGERKLASRTLRMQGRQRQTVWVEITASAVCGADGRAALIQATLHDLTSRKAAEASLRLHDRALRASASGIVLFSMAPGNALMSVNPAFEAITGYGMGEMARLGMRFLLDRIADPGSAADLVAAIGAEHEGTALFQFRRKDGVLQWLDCSIGPVRNEEGEVSHYVIAASDVTERMRMVAELRRAKEAAEQASLAKSEFLSRMSHELRTPLNSILGFAQLLEMQGADLNAVQRDRVGRIIQSGWRLRTLVDDVLDLARLEPGAPPFELEDVDLARLLGECTGLLEPIAAQRQIGIVAGPLPFGAQSVRADPMRLKQVLMNLLSNAVKFNRDGGSVTIAACLAGSGKVRVTIADTGPGIGADRQDELFKPFSRLDADKAETPGSGIGLALSLRLMELMAGRIGVDSAPGRGCAFWIEVAGTAFAGPLIDGAARNFFGNQGE